MRKVALVTGSRDWAEQKALCDVLDTYQPAVVIHGDCESGADYFASCYCMRKGALHVREIPMGANWKRHGNAAGPIRNSHMVGVALELRSAQYHVETFAFLKDPCVLVDRWKKSGTRDCLEKAENASLYVNAVVLDPQCTVVLSSQMLRERL